MTVDDEPLTARMAPVFELERENAQLRLSLRP